MEPDPRAKARKQDAAWELAILKVATLHRRDKVVWEPEGVKAVDQAEVPDAERVAVAVRVAEKVAGDDDKRTGSKSKNLKQVNPNPANGRQTGQRANRLT